MQPIPEVEVTAVPHPLPSELVVLDVREDEEWAAGHIEGALHIPLQQIPTRLADIPADLQMVVVCKVGGRSAQATGYLQAQGRDVVNLAGGMLAWDRAGRPIVSDHSAEPFVA